MTTKEDLRIEAVKASKEIIIDVMKFRENKNSINDYTVPAVAYLLLKVSNYLMPFVNLDALLEKEEISGARKAFVSKCINSEAWEECNQLVTRYSPEVFEELIRNYEDYTGSLRQNNITPSLAKLAFKLLKIEKDEKVADLCCGDGNFLLDAAGEVSANYLGLDISEDTIELLKIRAKIMGTEVNARTYDVFKLADKNAAKDEAINNDCCNYNQLEEKKFDKIFSCFPLSNGRLNKDEYANNPLMGTPEVKNLFKRTTSSDWLYSLLVAKQLRPDGKAVVVMKTGSCFNASDELIRKYFIDAGLVETVIALPSGLFNSPTLNVTMVVFSYGNEGIRMINAKEMFQRGRRRNELSDENIEYILQACEENEENSVLVDAETLHENENALSPEKYLVHNLQFENGVALGDLIINIKRGVNIKASQLDELDTEEETNIHYLRLSDIQYGLIESNLPCMKKVDKKHSVNMLDSMDLVISKLASPYKYAVVSKGEDEEILPVGNMYALELDKNRIDPYYLQAFLESDLGIASLKTITTGTTVPIISIDRLKTLQIPLPSMEEQKRITVKFFNNLTEIRSLKMKLEEAVKRMPLIFKEG